MIDKSPDKKKEISSFRSGLNSLYATDSGVDTVIPLLSLPDDLLWWMISLLRDHSVVTPEYDDSVWATWLDILSPHHIIPLFWYLSRNIPVNHLPPEWVQTTLRETYQSSGIRNLTIEYQIAQFTTYLREAGIEPIILKGPALGHLIYPYPSLRTGTDIDILIQLDQVRNSLNILKQMGYSLQADTHAISPHVFHHVALSPPPDKMGNLCVEVHWRLLYLPGEVTPPLEDLIDRAIWVSGTSGSFKALDIPDACIFAATHMCIGHSTMLRLSWIADFIYLCQFMSKMRRWDDLFTITSGGVLLAAVQRACKETGFWFDPNALYLKPGFWPDLNPGSEERLHHLATIAERTDRHIIEAVKQAPSNREALLSIFHILFMTDQIGNSNSVSGIILHLCEWVRIICARLKNRYFTPSSAKGRGSL